jgi:hypothetical protein
MLAHAYRDVARDEVSTHDLLTRAEEARSTSAGLRQSLAEIRASALCYKNRLASLAEELRVTTEALVGAAQTVASVGEKAMPITWAEQSAHPRPLNGHETITKESLARMAAQLAGRNPDQRVTIELAGLVAFDGQAWRYPDFIERAERAFAELAR